MSSQEFRNLHYKLTLFYEAINWVYHEDQEGFRQVVHAHSRILDICNEVSILLSAEKDLLVQDLRQKLEAERVTLKDELTSCQNERNTLENQRDVYRREEEASRLSRENFRTENQKERDSLEVEKEACRKSGESLDSRQADLDLQKEAFSKSKADLEQVRADLLEDLVKQRKALQVNQDALAEQRKALQVDQETLAEQRRVLQADQDTLAEQRKVLQADQDTLAQQREALSIAQGALTQQRDALSVDQAALLEQSDSLRLGREALTRDQEALQVDQDDLKKQRETHEAESDKLRKRQVKREADLDLRETSIANQEATRTLREELIDARLEIEKERLQNENRVEMQAKRDALDAEIAARYAQVQADENSSKSHWNTIADCITREDATYQAYFNLNKECTAAMRDATNTPRHALPPSKILSELPTAGRVTSIIDESFIGLHRRLDTVATTVGLAEVKKDLLSKVRKAEQRVGLAQDYQDQLTGFGTDLNNYLKSSAEASNRFKGTLLGMMEEQGSRSRETSDGIESKLKDITDALKSIQDDLKKPRPPANPLLLPVEAFTDREALKRELRGENAPRTGFQAVSP